MVPLNEITKAILIEDHPSYRRVIELTIDGDPAIELIGVFGTAEMAVQRLGRLDAVERPHVILLDLNLPGISGIEAIGKILAIAPHAKIIVLTQSSAKKDIQDAIQRGAAGYLLKSATAKEIVDGIKTVAAGGGALDGEVARYVMEMVKGPPTKTDPKLVLSPREREILVLLSKGMVKKEIASELGIGYGSVATYIRRLYEKLNVQNAPAAIDMAHRLGVFPDDRHG
ncbi:response regulator [Rubripirellula tenax]|uniref:response regulator n=1 Tax=Rubripirellula tenax TaxID=2528015 RepID=UPI001FE32A86|nr:response regulator transcription factor [Rubripirellula tenax]